MSGAVRRLVIAAVVVAAAFGRADAWIRAGDEISDRARADLGFLVRQITTRHPNPYHLTPKADFDREVADLSARLPSLTPHAVVVGFAKIAALIGDGHTRAPIPPTGGLLPIEIEWLDGRWRVVRALADQRNLLGITIEQFDSTEIATAAQRVNTLVAAHESEGWSRFITGRLLMYADVLDALGISKERGRVTVNGVTDSGERRSLVVSAVARSPSDQWTEPSASLPLSRQRDLRQAAFAWRAVDGTQTGYVAFNNYLTDGSRGNFGDLTRGVFREMDTANVDRIIVDLRWNGGGDFTRGREYVLNEIRKRERWLKPRAFYVLTGRRTFSAAMVNTVDFKRAAGAILVGEPTGARPNSYSETGSFRLPNTGVQATVSICRYEAWPADVPGVPPDQVIPPSWADYRDGRDAALEWILRQPPPDPAAPAFVTKTTLMPPCRR